MIIWITGLSGAGKTTVATELINILKAAGTPCVHLDGDVMRQVIQDPTAGHDSEGRLKTAYRYARLAHMLAEQGVVVVVSTISLFHEIHAYNRSQTSAYLEVLIDVELSVLKQRNAKNIYSAAQQVAGVDVAVEFPLAPHLTLNNNLPQDNLNDLARIIYQKYQEGLGEQSKDPHLHKASYTASKAH